MAEVTVGVNLCSHPFVPSDRLHSSSALESLFIQFASMIKGLARRFAYDADSVEDLTQEGYLAFVEAISLFDPTRGARLGTFVYQRARSRMLHWCRSQQRALSLLNPNARGRLCSLDEEIESGDEGTLNLHQVVADDGGSASQGAHLGMLRVDIQRSLSQLAERQAKAMRLLFWDNLSPSEIASCLGVSRPRVTVLVKRGLMNLSRELTVVA